MTGKVVNSRFLPLNNFVASRQESAPKPQNGITFSIIIYKRRNKTHFSSSCL